MKNVSFPLFIFAALALGVVIEVAEGQDRRAGWVLALILLLGMIVFNAREFTAQINAITGRLAAPAVAHQKKVSNKRWG